MPSTTSSSVSSDFASSTVITPSLPTFFMASERNLPISASPLAEMVPTWAISSFEVTFLEFLTRSATTASTAMSIPRFRSIGFMPAATDLAPSLTIAAASTVAVVVPSPAASADFEATSRTICAPMFSNLSSSSISLATVTPSLVMRGAPNDLSSTTLRPFGAGPLAEQHPVTHLEVDRDQLAALVAAARAYGGDFALRGFFLGSVRNDDAAGGLLFGVDALDHDAVVKRTEFHAVLLSF